MNTKDTPLPPFIRDPAKRRAWINFQFHMRGTSLAALAAEHGTGRQAAYHAFTRPYPRMERLIADALGTTPQQLFPERYGPDGLPNRPRGRPGKPLVKHTAKQPNRGQKRAECA